MCAHRAEGRPVRPRRDRARSPTLVGNERRLTALYLLTVADIRGTSPKVWNAWKGKLLEDLYRLTLRALGGARAEPRRRDRGAQARGAAAAQPASSLPGDAHEAALGHAGLSYFVRHDAGRHRLARALAVAPRRHADGRSCARACRRVGEGLQVLVYAPDQPDLFARICGYFDSAGFSILDAKVHTTRDRLRARHLPGRQPACSTRPLPRPDRAGRDAAGAAR